MDRVGWSRYPSFRLALIRVISSPRRQTDDMRYLVLFFRSIPKANRSLFAGGTGEWISLHRADRAGPEYEYLSRSRCGAANGTRAGNLKAILTRAGLILSHVVKTTVFLRDMNDFAGTIQGQTERKTRRMVVEPRKVSKQRQPKRP